MSYQVGKHFQASEKTLQEPAAPEPNPRGDQQTQPNHSQRHARRRRKNNNENPELLEKGRMRSRQGSIMDRASSGGQMAEQAGRTGREGDRRGRQGKRAGGAKRGKLPASSEAQGNTMQRQASRTKCQRHPKITAEGECHTHLVPKDAPDTCLRWTYSRGWRST